MMNQIEICLLCFCESDFEHHLMIHYSYSNGWNVCIPLCVLCLTFIRVSSKAINFTDFDIVCTYLWLKLEQWIQLQPTLPCLPAQRVLLDWVLIVQFSSASSWHYCIILQLKSMISTLLALHLSACLLLYSFNGISWQRDAASIDQMSYFSLDSSINQLILHLHWPFSSQS